MSAAALSAVALSVAALLSAAALSAAALRAASASATAAAPVAAADEGAEATVVPEAGSVSRLNTSCVDLVDCSIHSATVVVKSVSAGAGAVAGVVAFAAAGAVEGSAGGEATGAGAAGGVGALADGTTAVFVDGGETGACATAAGDAGFDASAGAAGLAASPLLAMRSITPWNSLLAVSVKRKNQSNMPSSSVDAGEAAGAGGGVAGLEATGGVACAN